MLRRGYRIPAAAIAVAFLLIGITGCRPRAIATEQAQTAERARESDAGRSTRDDRAPSTEVTEGFREMPIGEVDVSDASVDEINASGVLRPIYFAYDSDELDESARSTLADNAAWMRGNTGFRIVVEGHCDERGTIEYNLSLGQRRADAVRGYLTGLGVAGERLRVVSFGEERPAASPGHTDEARALNRRAEFVVER